MVWPQCIAGARSFICMSDSKCYHTRRALPSPTPGSVWLMNAVYMFCFVLCCQTLFLNTLKWSDLKQDFILELLCIILKLSLIFLHSDLVAGCQFPSIPIARLSWTRRTVQDKKNQNGSFIVIIPWKQFLFVLLAVALPSESWGRSTNSKLQCCVYMSGLWALPVVMPHCTDASLG